MLLSEQFEQEFGCGFVEERDQDQINEIVVDAAEIISVKIKYIEIT